MSGGQTPTCPLESRLDGQVVAARPLVPRAGVVPRVVAGSPEALDGERRARADVAVRRDLRAFRQADELAHLLCGPALPELDHVEVPRTGQVPLANIAAAPGRAVELAGGAHVEHRERRIVEPSR